MLKLPNKVCHFKRKYFYAGVLGRILRSFFKAAILEDIDGKLLQEVSWRVAMERCHRECTLILDKIQNPWKYI